MQIAKMVPAFMLRFSAMSTWSTEETTELVSLWPTASARQIAAQLKRSRSAVSRKAQRLCLDGVLPRCGAKHFTVPPVQARPGRTRSKASATKPTPPPPSIDDTLAVRPCSFSELDAGRCHWPLGDVHQVATVFCGGNVARGALYCAHHWRMARR
jgi:hypothetical protein